MKLINHKEYEAFARVYGGQIYAYLFAIVVFTIFGMIFQSYFVPEVAEEKKGPIIKENDDMEILSNKPNDKVSEQAQVNSVNAEAKSEVPSNTEANTAAKETSAVNI